jgi:hypothetical protein
MTFVNPLEPGMLTIKWTQTVEHFTDQIAQITTHVPLIFVISLGLQTLQHLNLVVVTMWSTEQPFVMTETSVPKIIAINKILLETFANTDSLQIGMSENTSARKQKSVKPPNVPSTNVSTVTSDALLHLFASTLFVTEPPMELAKHTQQEFTKSTDVEFVQVMDFLVSQPNLETQRKPQLSLHWQLV